MAPRAPKRPAYRPPARRPVRSAPPAAPRTATLQKRGRQTALSLPLLVVSAAAGIAAFILGQLLETALGDSLSRPVMMGLQFALLFALLAVAIFIYSHTAGIFEETPFVGGGCGPALLICLLGVVLLFGLGTLFQWIYGTDFYHRQTTPTSYVFVIDDSGSMSGNDPEGKRYRAISELLADADPDFPYMVYRFSDSAELAKPMAPVSEGIPELSPQADNGTAIHAALTQVIDDWENGVWEGGASPRVVLLTDGQATDVSVFRPIRSLLRRYRDADISISTIGLGNADERLLQRIAGSSGGVFLSVDDISDLRQAMEEAALRYAGRDLLSDRAIPRLDGLYAVLRILFVAVLGAVIGCLALIPYGFATDAALTLISAVGKALLGAILLEVGICALGWSERLMWFVLWLLLALTVATCPVAYRNQQGRIVDM